MTSTDGHCLVSIIDRKTKFTKLALLSAATAQLAGNAIIQLLSPYKSHVYTITADNGKEFASHKKVAQELQANVYFARPYHSWERGLNENTNGLVRQYFPKKSKFTNLSTGRVKYVEYLLNSRPRKSLNFKTPNEVFLPLRNYALQC